MNATLLMTWLDIKRYFIISIDDYLDYTLVYLVRNKSDTLNNFKVFVSEIEN